MVEIEGILVSSELLEKKFVCDLSACKGACCVEGVSGAPLEIEEAGILENILEDVKPYMTSEGIETVEEDGAFSVDWDRDYVTPLVNGQQCAYVYYENGVTRCAIEKAHLERKTDFKKPISCHLYPIRITKLKTGDALNYHRWDICEPACACGDKLSVKVYQFLKTPLIRKYGEDWYNKLAETVG